MTFLPIVARELRGASRRHGTFWARTFVALLALLAGVVIVVVMPGSPGAQSGRVIFQGLSGMVLVCCLLSGRVLTVDSLSSEKREGTLGLLFLTDLKGYDVVLGKLAATSLNGFYSLLAVMPVLAFSMLLGGVSNGEFWRMVLVLADTFLFSLAAGMFCSAVNQDARRAAAANFGLILFLCGVLPAVNGFIAYFSPAHRLIPEFFYACPAFPFVLSFDSIYTTRAVGFWWSVALLHALTWLLLLLASWLLPRAWQEKPVRKEKTRVPGLWHAWHYGPESGRAAYRKELLDTNAFYWLAGRVRFKPVHVWTFLGFMAGWWILGWLGMGPEWISDATVVVLALMLNSTLKLWIALEAGQQLAEDQRMGTLELMLPTPLTTHDILHGQWLALRRQFLRPMAVVIITELILLRFTLQQMRGDPQLVYLVVAGAVMLVADSAALAWLAMRRALTSKKTSRAIIGTVTRVLVLPWILFFLVRFVLFVGSLLWPEKISLPAWQLDIGLWFGLGLAADLFYGLTARHQLLANFRKLALHRFESSNAGWLAKTFAAPSPEPAASPGDVAAGKPVTPPIRRRRWKRVAVAFTLLALLAIAGWMQHRHTAEYKYPPPVIVAITQSNMPLIILPGQISLFALPDGSIWRWGARGAMWQPGNDVPAMVATNQNWAQMTGNFNSGFALKRDGAVWGWDNSGILPSRLAVFRPMPVYPSNTWKAMARLYGPLLAIRSDGTLWGLTRNFSNPGPPAVSGSAHGQSAGSKLPDSVDNDPEAIQIGTNNNWVQVVSRGWANVGLQDDGTLWAWSWKSLAKAITNPPPVPARMFVETNWAAFEPWFYSGNVLAWTKSGDLWTFPISTNYAGTSVNAFSHLIVTNSRPGHVASAAGKGQLGQMYFYKIQDDGTLWKSAFFANLAGITGTMGWSQVGTRQDWVSVWGSVGTAFGLTRDGTLWTWGIDWTRQPEVPFSARVAALRERILQAMGKSAGGGGAGPVQPWQPTPRPLMRLVFQGTNSVTNAEAPAKP